MSEKIILIDDDSNILMSVSLSLRAEGWEVESFTDSEKGLIALQRNKPDIAILDIKMPRLDGMQVLQQLRNFSDLPVIFLTSKDDELDEAIGLRMGADDYITKPFSPRELLARLKALLRRSGGPKNNLIEASGICLDLNSYRITINGNEIQISPTEYKLLEVLMRNPDRAFERSQLLDRVWGRQVYVEERTVDVHMLRLRKILKPHGLDATLQTVRGIGYRFTSVS